MAREYELQGLTYAEYHAIHVWLRENHPSPLQCPHCCFDGGYLENALIRGKRYERNIDNFIQLCVRCHRRYDRGGDPEYITEPIRKLFKELKKYGQTSDSVKIAEMTGISYEKVLSTIDGGVIMTVDIATKVLTAYTELIKSREPKTPHEVPHTPYTTHIKL